MGMIMSISRALEHLRFVSPAKGRVHKAELIVMLDKREGKTGPDVALVKLASGEWTVLRSRHTPNGNWACMGYGLDWLQANTLKALVRAGAITEDQRLTHLRNEEARRAKSERAHHLKMLTQSCEALGISVPDLSAPMNERTDA
jgi:hypothetical protein